MHRPVLTQVLQLSTKNRGSEDDKDSEGRAGKSDFLTTLSHSRTAWWFRGGAR